MQPEILSDDDSLLWRTAYIESFIDNKSEHYQKYISTRHQFSDGSHYVGYLWDCLKKFERVSFQHICHEIIRFDEVFVMADDHSRDRIVGAPLWPFTANSIAKFQPQNLLEQLPSLPEDIYIFDSSVTWTYILTHEEDGKRRICAAAEATIGEL